MVAKRIVLILAVNLASKWLCVLEIVSCSFYIYLRLHRPPRALCSASPPPVSLTKLRRHLSSQHGAHTACAHLKASKRTLVLPQARFRVAIGGSRHSHLRDPINQLSSVAGSFPEEFSVPAPVGPESPRSAGALLKGLGDDLHGVGRRVPPPGASPIEPSPWFERAVLLGQSRGLLLV
jgi:hypothetical protein